MKKNKLIISIIAVLLMGVIVSGGSFAYFVWTSGTGDRSTVNITLEQTGITMHIETEQKTMGGLRPTRNCNNANAYVDATVTVVNNTGAAAVPSLKIKARVIKGGSGELTQEALSHIKYSVVNPGDSCDQIMTHDTKSTESTTNQDLLFMNASSWSTQLSFQSVATDGSWSHIPSTGNSMFNNTTTSIGTLASSPAYLPRQYYLKDNSDASFKKGDVNGITFVAAPHKTTTHQFRVYVWIDEEYTVTTIGNVISDPLQNAQIELSFSEQSIIQQVSSDLIGGGAVTPNSKAAGIYDEDGNYTSWDDLISSNKITLDGTTITGSDTRMTGELVIPEGITIIGYGAFMISNLTSVIIPDSVTSIGSSAFEGSDSLTSVVIGNSVTTIDGASFWDTSLTSIIIPKSVTSIGFNAFNGNPLTDVYYKGTEEEWNDITISSNNDPLINATKHYNYSYE